ncbi:MAG: DNA ligase [Eubacteriales bacterium]|nr:DNA ligase [Eubacteriales bacterium]
MSRMSDMAQTIKELRSAAAAISDAADWLTKVFSGESQAEGTPDSPPEPELTLEQVRAVLADKSRKGHTAEIRALLQKYGAAKLSGIDPSHYKALLADAEVLTDAT